MVLFGFYFLFICLIVLVVYLTKYSVVGLTHSGILFQWKSFSKQTQDNEDQTVLFSLLVGKNNTLNFRLESVY